MCKMVSISYSYQIRATKYGGTRVQVLLRRDKVAFHSVGMAGV